LRQALLAFPQLPGGFSNRLLRDRFTALFAQPVTALTAGQMTYHLRRLRPHRLIQRIARKNCYRLTDFGLRTALFFTRVYYRLLRPGLGRMLPPFSNLSCPPRRAFDKLNQEVTSWVQESQHSAAQNLTLLHQVFDFEISRAIAFPRDSCNSRGRWIPKRYGWC